MFRGRLRLPAGAGSSMPVSLWRQAHRASLARSKTDSSPARPRPPLRSRWPIRRPQPRYFEYVSFHDVMGNQRVSDGDLVASTEFDEPSGATRPRSPGSFIWSQIRHLVSGMPGPVAALSIASVLAGFAEAGILAILAQSALMVVNHAERVHLSLGPGHFHPTLGALLALGMGCLHSVKDRHHHRPIVCPRRVGRRGICLTGRRTAPTMR